MPWCITRGSGLFAIRHLSSAMKARLHAFLLLRLFLFLSTTSSKSLRTEPAPQEPHVRRSNRRGVKGYGTVQMVLVSIQVSRRAEKCSSRNRHGRPNPILRRTHLSAVEPWPIHFDSVQISEPNRVSRYYVGRNSQHSRSNHGHYVHLGCLADVRNINGIPPVNFSRSMAVLTDSPALCLREGNMRCISMEVRK